MAARLKIGHMLVLPLLAACAAAAPDPDDDPQPARSRAALATLAVENLSAESLGIFYRLTAPPATEVRVGSVSAEAVAEMAPVPAGEALVLIARTPTGAQLSLPPQTFELGGRWVWRIPADARFTLPADSTRP